MKLIRPDQVSGMNIHYKFYSLEYFLESQMRAGFKTIELWAGSPHFFLSNLEYDDCKKVSKMARERGLTIQVITPKTVLSPISLQPETRICMPKVLNISKKGLDAGEELGCKVMAVHSGRGYLNEDREEGWKRGRDMLHGWLIMPGTKGITLAMESLRPDETNLATTVDDVKRMLTEINHPNFKCHDRHLSNGRGRRDFTAVV